MKKSVVILLFLIGITAHARIEALVGTPTSMKSLCLINNSWQSCFSSDTALSTPDETTFTDAFFIPSTQQTVAFGYSYDIGNTQLFVSCKSTPNSKWANCTPSSNNIPSGRFYNALIYNQVAHDGNGNFMVIGTRTGDDFGSMMAACRTTDASGQVQWFDCSPTLDTSKFYPSSVAYGDGQWVVLGSFGRINRLYLQIPAVCMDANTQVWSACNVKINDPNRALNIDWMSGIAYNGNEWVVTGRGEFSYDTGRYTFQSFCSSSMTGPWTDCVGSDYPVSVSQRLIKDDQLGLLQINTVNVFDFSLQRVTVSTNVLCKAPGAAWYDCTGNLKQVDDIYNSGIVNMNGQWILGGNQCEYFDVKCYNHLNYLTATQDDLSFWTVAKQKPASNTWKLFDIYWVDE